MLRRLARWTDSSGPGRRLRRALISNALTGRAIRSLDARRLERLRRRGDPVELSKSRWRSADPSPGLTWGDEVSGDAAVRAAAARGVFGPGRSVLEIGPGYGRIVRSALALDQPFGRYLGLDLSERNVEHLRGTLDDPRLEFRRGDAETARLDAAPDALVSFLTFKHLYPSFEAALANLVPQLAAGAVVVFDLLEGERAYFHRDGRTFIRHYERDEVLEILTRVGMDQVELGAVEHEPGRERLLVAARRP